MLREFIVDMYEEYPFGELSSEFIDATHPLVKKTLHFQDESEYQMIQEMIYLLKAARHDNLINVERVLEGEDFIELYYEYAPFRLQKWLLVIDEDMINGLRQQLMDVIQYLIRSSFKFEFNPNCVGISKDMKIKYFLKEFSINLQFEQDDFKQLKYQVKRFFDKLWEEAFVQQSSRTSESPENTNCINFESLSTRASISQLTTLNQHSLFTMKKQQQTDSIPKQRARLSQKIQSSLKKSMEVLSRFKRGNLK